MLKILDLESEAVYTNIICFIMQLTFIKSSFIDYVQIVNQQMESFYNSILDKQLS